MDLGAGHGQVRRGGARADQGLGGAGVALAWSRSRGARRARTGAALAIALASLLAVGAGTAAGRATLDPIARARLLHRFANERLDDPSVESRQRCQRDLLEAIELDPEGRAGNHWLLLGRLRELGRMDREARSAYRNACAQQPSDPEPWLGLGRVYRREWLRTLDGDALKRAAGVLDTAATARSGSSTVWLALVPVLYELPELPRAALAAERALRGHPRVPEAALAAGLMAWRTGALERADSLFRAALPRLEPDLRAMFEHPGRFTGRTPRRPPGLLTSMDDEGDTLVHAPRGPYVDDPARDALPDPDPTTPENELRLEYYSRVAHAFLLFNDALHPGLDARAETFIRYGPPAKVLLNPPGVPLVFKPNVVATGPHTSMAEYALDAQLWIYPDLGMNILLNDRTLTGHYSTPALRDPWPNSAPDPAVLARRHDLLATGDGFAVFPTLAPGAQRLDVTQTLVAFEGASGPRLAAFVGAEAESLEARWVVTDARGRTVARGAQAMGRSLCGEGASAVEFDANLPPGRYAVVSTARDARGRRGIARDTVTLASSLGALAMSALVPCCGQPAMLVDRDAVRLEPLAGGVVRGREPLAVYFEITHLATGASGTSRYTFDYVVERLAVDRRGRTTAVATTTTWASREEVFRGRVRRQFLSVPVARMEPGRYRLTVTVHDTLSGLSEARALEFERE